MTAALPAPVIESHDGVIVVRDDLLAGGTKRRYLEKIISADDRELVYASPCYGGAQIAIATVAAARQIKATIFCAKRKSPHAMSLAAKAAGARVIQINAGYMTVCQARAEQYAKAAGARLLPFGMDTPEAVATIGEVAAEVAARAGEIEEVWCVGGSGTLTRGLQLGFPDSEHHVVQVGRALTQKEAARAIVHISPLKFADDCKPRDLPPFPSCLNYDAKAWRVLKSESRRRALFWNVMGPAGGAS